MEKKKYNKIIAQSSLDCIFALGLFRRIYNLPFSFKLIVRTARNSIIIGTPLMESAHVSNCFIIDNSRYDSTVHRPYGSNILLYDDKYGSLTDMVVDIFGLDIPEAYMDAIFNVAVGAIEDDDLARHMYIAWLLSNMKYRHKLVDYITAKKWSLIDEWLKKKNESNTSKQIEKLAYKICKKCKSLSPGACYIVYVSENRIERLAARYALEILRRSTRIAVGLEVNKYRLVEKCFILSNHRLLGVSVRFMANEWITIPRPHMLRLIMRIPLALDTFLPILRSLLISVMNRLR